MTGSTNAETNAFLDRLAAELAGSATLPGVSPGFCHWLRTRAPGGYVGGRDAGEEGERGLMVQALEHVDSDEADDVTFAGEMGLVCENAEVPRTLAIIPDYLAGPLQAKRTLVRSMPGCGAVAVTCGNVQSVHAGPSGWEAGVRAVPARFLTHP